MNIKRAIGFGALLYLTSFVLYGVLAFSGLMSLDSYDIPLKVYVVNWIIYIPITLLLAKWYFKKETPSVRKGFWLGVIAIAVAFVIDGISVAGTAAAGQSLEPFAALYGDWKFWVTILWLIVLTTFAGGEFDGTFSKKK